MSTTPDSQRYPLFSLVQCIPAAEAVRDGGGKNVAVPKSVIAHALQCSATSGAFLQRLASARAYGLIEGRGSYSLTELGKGYFFPISATEKQRALLAMLGQPPTYGELLKRLDGQALPQRSMLANILHRDCKVPDSWKDRVAGFFIRDAQFVGALDSQGYLRYSSAMHSPQSLTTIPANTEQDEDVMPRSGQPAASRLLAASYSEVPQREGVDVWSFSQKGKTVRLETPSELTIELWNKLSKYIEVLKPDTNNT